MIKRLFGRINNTRVRSQRFVTTQIRKRPLTSFLVALLALFLIILLGKFLTPAAKEAAQPEIIKTVSVLSVGQSPTIKVMAQVQKKGVIVISALTPGVVSKIWVNEGQSVVAGKTLVSLSSNYQGGNTASLSRQLAFKQYQNNKDTFDAQKEIIQKQREIAEKSNTNTEELRKISEKTNDDTKSLLSTNEQILSTIDTNLSDLIANNPGGVNDSLILQTRQARAQVLQGVNSLRQATRSLDFANNTSNPPTQIANLSRDLTLKQLEIQEKALTLNKEVSQIQLNLAAVSEAMMFPVSPKNGTVQKIHVNTGQQVAPGTPLVTVYAPSGNVLVIAKVPFEIAKSINHLDSAKLFIDNEELILTPEFISTEATDGNLYQVIFNVPENLHEKLTNNEFIEIELPIGSKTSAAFPFVPLDSVFQTQEAAFVYIVEGDKASSRKVELGEVIGSDVEVKSGLKSGDKVILDRNILAGDKLEVK